MPSCVASLVERRMVNSCGIALRESAADKDFWLLFILEK